MQKTEESLRRLKKVKKQSFSLFGNAGPEQGKEDEGRDQERIKVQMILDVEAFGKDAEGLGVEVEQCVEWRTLKEMVKSETVEGD
jgi:hypothetical protein